MSHPIRCPLCYGDITHEDGHLADCPTRSGAKYTLGQYQEANPTTEVGGSTITVREVAVPYAPIEPLPRSRESIARRAAALSAWIDESDSNEGRDPEALSWHRVAKVAEEAGEAVEAMIGWTGGNPRKGVIYGREAVVKELLDVAVTGLAAVEHLTGNKGRSVDMLAEHLERLTQRAGLE